MLNNITCNVTANINLKTYKNHVEIAVGLRIVLFNHALDFIDRHLSFIPVKLFVLIYKIEG